MPRDGSGNYTLPLGNPVVSGTIIDVNWANPTMDDIALQLNNVITRDGLLGPTAPMYFPDGTSVLPGVAFAADHGTGMWRDVTQLGLSYAGVPVQTWNASGSTITGDLTIDGELSPKFVRSLAFILPPGYVLTADDIYPGRALWCTNFGSSVVTLPLGIGTLGNVFRFFVYSFAIQTELTWPVGVSVYLNNSLGVPLVSPFLIEGIRVFDLVSVYPDIYVIL